MKVTITNEQFQYMQLFEKLLKVPVLDCYTPNDKSVVFVVPQKHGRMAVGKKGENVKKLAEKMENKSIYIIEFDENIKKFVQNIWRPKKINVFIKPLRRKLLIEISSKSNKYNKFYINLTRDLIKRLFKEEVIVRAKRVIRRKKSIKKEEETKIKEKENKA
jgi:NusA-like KH domain protein